MNISDTNNIISYLKKHDATRIGVFGSYSRGDNNQSSDIDILVSFKSIFGLLKLVRIERELSEVLGRKVDLLTENALKNDKLRSYIDKDLKIIYE